MVCARAMVMLLIFSDVNDGFDFLENLFCIAGRGRCNGKNATNPSFFSKEIKEKVTLEMGGGDGKICNGMRKKVCQVQTEKSIRNG